MTQAIETKKEGEGEPVTTVTKTPEEQEQIISNLVEELKTERAKKQEALDAAAELLKETKTTTASTDPEELVRIALEKRDRDAELQAKQEAEAEFRNSISELAPDNDPGDLKYNLFKKELSKFNLEGLKTKEQIKQRLQEVYDFANRTKTNGNDSQLNQFSSTPSNPGPIKGESNLSVISKDEEALIQSKGWTKERYLKLKANHPKLIETLIRR